MLIFVGASASGKTELAYYLRKNYQYQKCITTTTRPQRVHETQGVDYHFLSEETFKKRIEEDQFIETNEYHGYMYGLQKKDVVEDSVIILDPNGANHLVSKDEHRVFICYVTSSKQTRQQRMLARGDDEDIINKRIALDDDIFDRKHLIIIHYVLNNENKSIDTLARDIHEAYQTWKKEKIYDY